MGARTLGVRHVLLVRDVTPRAICFFTVRATRFLWRRGGSQQIFLARLISLPLLAFASLLPLVLSLNSVAPAENVDLETRDRRRGRTERERAARNGNRTRAPRVEGEAEGEPDGGGKGRRREGGGGGRAGGSKGERNTRDRQHSFVLSLARFGSQPCDIQEASKYLKGRGSRTHSFEPSDPPDRKQRTWGLRVVFLCPLAREARFPVAPAVTRIPVALGALARKPAARWCAVRGRDNDNNGDVQTEVSDSPSAEKPRFLRSVIDSRC